MDRGRMDSNLLERSIVVIAFGILLSSCSSSALTPQDTLAVVPSTVVESPSPSPTETLLPATKAPPPSHSLTAVDATYQIVQNTSFNTGIDPWHARIGNLTRSTSEYYTTPASGKMITSGIDNVGVAGQCVPIKDILTDWPNNTGQKQIAFDIFLKTDINVNSVTLIVIFHQADCSQPGQLHVQAGTIQSEPFPGGPSWTHLSTTGPIPADAVSADILVWAVGKYDTAQVYFDDTRSYPLAQD